MKTNIIANQRVSVELPVCTRISARRTVKKSGGRNRENGGMTEYEYRLQDKFLDFLSDLDNYRTARGKGGFLNTDESREAILHFLGAIKV